MTEINDARALRDALRTRVTDTGQHATWAWWAPGDFTRYRVTYVNALPEDVSFFTRHQLLIFEAGTQALTLPYTPHKPWTVESFLRTHSEAYAGWWAGIRPVLAAFGWTSTRPSDLSYSANDANAIGRLLEA